MNVRWSYESKTAGFLRGELESWRLVLSGESTRPVEGVTGRCGKIGLSDWMNHASHGLICVY